MAYQKRSIPLIWKVQRRTGATDVETQCQLLEKLAPWFPDEVDITLIGDGEFHGVDLMAWLQEQQWHFRLRLHKDTWVRLSDGKWIQLQDLEIEKGDRLYLQNVLLTRDKCYSPVNLAITWDPDEDDPWYIATDQEANYYTLLDYSRRMWIEEMFGDFKEGRFHLQQGRLWDPERLSRLLLALGIVYTWLMHLGAYVIKRGGRHFVDRSDRRDCSVPSIGRLWFQRRLNNGERLRIGFKPYF